MSKTSNLKNAKAKKNDEFYTQYEDIQKELNHYEKHFKGKVVLCNCDDPFESNFAKFFLRNFNYLGLKRLICTSYSGSPFAGTQLTFFDLTGEETAQGHGYVLDVSSVPMKNNRGVSDEDIDKLLRSKKAVKELKGNGDFRSPECIKYLEQADIVVTNPPFSLFREYVATLMEYDKKFLILGNMNAVTYKEFFPLIRDNKVWVGVNEKGGTRKGNSLCFTVPNSYDGKLIDIKGSNMAQVSAWWYTNLDFAKRHENLALYKHYTPEEYPLYDNYEAINVDKSTDVPMDYDGIMGVPISFLNGFYCPEQFDIVELGNSRDNFTPNKDYINPKKHLKDGTITNGGAINCVLAIEQDVCPKGVVYYTSDNSKYLVPPYARILIRRKQ